MLYILIFDGYLFIMLRGNKETRKKIRTDIHEIVTAGYEQPKGEKKIKLQKNSPSRGYFPLFVDFFPAYS